MSIDEFVLVAGEVIAPAVGDGEHDSTASPALN
jgi:hypothetical protein